MVGRRSLPDLVAGKLPRDPWAWIDDEVTHQHPEGIAGGDAALANSEEAVRDSLLMEREILDMAANLAMALWALAADIRRAVRVAAHAVPRRSARVPAVPDHHAGEGRLANAGDVYFLTFEEMHSAQGDLRAIVTGRREVQDRGMRRRHVPRVLSSDGTEPEAVHHGALVEGDLVGMREAVTRIKIGERISVDGSTGAVIMVEAASGHPGA